MAISSSDDFSLKQKEGFHQLQIVQNILQGARREDHPAVLQHLWDLPFIPTERYRLQSCVKSLKIAHPAVTERLQSILLAAGEALTRMNKPEQLYTIVSLAAAVPDRISQHAYQRLNELQAQLA